MVLIRILLFSLLISLNLADEKSHDLWLTKLDKPELNPDWLTDSSYKLKKISTHGKSIDLNVTLQQDIDSDTVLCQVKVFQKSGGKYVKAPADLPPTPCCKIMSDANSIWPCIQKATNFPKNCPISKGVISMKDFNPSVCAYPKNLPPGLPEEYKIIFTGTLNLVELWKYVGYGMVKKKM